MDKHNNSEIQKKEIRKKLGLPPKNPATNSSKNKEKIPIPPHRFYTEKEEVTKHQKHFLKTLNIKAFLLAQSLCILF